MSDNRFAELEVVSQQDGKEAIPVIKKPKATTYYTVAVRDQKGKVSLRTQWSNGSEVYISTDQDEAVRIFKRARKEIGPDGIAGAYILTTQFGMEQVVLPPTEVIIQIPSLAEKVSLPDPPATGPVWQGRISDWKADPAFIAVGGFFDPYVHNTSWRCKSICPHVSGYVCELKNGHTGPHALGNPGIYNCPPGDGKLSTWTT